MPLDFSLPLSLSLPQYHPLQGTPALSLGLQSPHLVSIGSPPLLQEIGSTTLQALSMVPATPSASFRKEDRPRGRPAVPGASAKLPGERWLLGWWGSLSFV